jgi:serine/threonine protein kinase
LFDYLLEKKRLDEQEVKIFTSQIISALEYIHRKGYIHRDLKCENILLDNKANIKLIDFGFCKKLNRFQKAYSFVGTLEYLAPEMLSKSGHDEKVDIWALGVLMYELRSLH